MTLQRLNRLQWIGLVAGPLVLAAGHLSGLGVTLAECNVGSGRWGIDNNPTEIAILVVAALVLLLAAAASAAIVVQTQGTSYEDDPPLSRIRFFAIAALVSNVVFAIVMTLDLVGNVFNTACRGG